MPWSASKRWSEALPECWTPSKAVQEVSTDFRLRDGDVRLRDGDARLRDDADVFGIVSVLIEIRKIGCNTRASGAHPIHDKQDLIKFQRRHIKQ